MKLTRELKAAILVIASIALFIWGYSFLKGKDVFATGKTLYVKYNNVSGLSKSAPVTLNGFKVGKVVQISIQEDATLLVELQIDTDFPISKSSKAEIYDSGLMGGRQIAIIPNFEDKTVAENDAYLTPSNKLGLTDNIAVQIEPLKNKIEKLLDNANVLFANVNSLLDVNTQQNLKNSIASLSETMKTFSDASKSINDHLVTNKQKINNSLSNFDKISTNFASLSDSLASINIKNTVAQLESSLANINSLTNKLNNGQGTMGKLLTDDAMYTNFTKTAKELELLLEDLRLHPTRYINVSVFGKKEKPYVQPINEKIE